VTTFPTSLGDHAATSAFAPSPASAAEIASVVAPVERSQDATVTVRATAEDGANIDSATAASASLHPHARPKIAIFIALISPRPFSKAFLCESIIPKSAGCACAFEIFPQMTRSFMPE
jgi:hypothetical protein